MMCVILMCLLLLSQPWIENCDAALTCTGCTQPSDEADYYCSENIQFFYFYCEVFSSPGLTWDISNITDDVPISFTQNSMLENIITKGSATAILVKKEPTGLGTGNLSSHLWIDFRNITNIYINITCEGGTNETFYKKLLPLGNPSSPYGIYAVATILGPITEGLFVYYRWNHPNPEQVFYYETGIYVNNTLIHAMNVPATITNATCQLDSNKIECVNCYVVVVTAVDRCEQRRTSNATIIFESVADNQTNCTRPDEPKNEGDHVFASLGLGALLIICILII